MEPYTRTHTHWDEQKQFVQSFVHLIARLSDKMNKAQLLKVRTKEKKELHTEKSQQQTHTRIQQSHAIKQCQTNQNETQKWNSIRNLIAHLITIHTENINKHYSANTHHITLVIARVCFPNSMCGYLICCAASTLCVCIRFPFRFSVYPSVFFFSLRRSFSFTPQLSTHIYFISIALLVLFCLRTMWMRVCVCVMVCPYHHQIYGINPFYSSLHSISMNTHRVWVSCFEKQRTQTYLNMYKKKHQQHNITTAHWNEERMNTLFCLRLSFRLFLFAFLRIVG